MQARLLEAQRQNLGGDAAVVAGTLVLAARRPGAPGLLAQVASLREGEEGNDVRAREGDHAGADDAAFGGRMARRGANEIGQAGEVGLAAQDQLEARLVGQHVLPEPRRQVGQPLHDPGIALLRRAVHPGAGAHEVDVVALQRPQLLGAQAELASLVVQRVDAPEQGAVHVDAAVVPGQQRRHLALDGLQRGRGLARGQVVEQAGDPVEQASGPVERGDGVVEARRRRRIADRADLLEMGLHRDPERRSEMLGARLGERRQAVFAGPGLQQRVVGHGGFHFLRLMSFRSRSS